SSFARTAFSRSLSLILDALVLADVPVFGCGSRSSHPPQTKLRPNNTGINQPKVFITARNVLLTKYMPTSLRLFFFNRLRKFFSLDLSEMSLVGISRIRCIMCRKRRGKFRRELRAASTKMQGGGQSVKVTSKLPIAAAGRLRLA